ncbi:MAG: hypothetical protein V8R42_02345 [Clostridia bacterium]
MISCKTLRNTRIDGSFIMPICTIRTSSVSEDELEVLIIKIVQSSNTFPKLEFL